ncbi:Disintegrin and metalloproteinase domain-containing protein 22 [Sarcoptes scabiei]|nr:Disintegrin and metalloproteinase domain-containing protein 22 [Sarcoptes scabiei]
MKSIFILTICLKTVEIFFQVISAMPLISSSQTDPNEADLIGVAFRKQISQSLENKIFIDRLSSEEIDRYHSTGHLPNRTESLINSFILKNDRRPISMTRKSNSDPVKLLLSDRYEIISDGQEPYKPNNENYEFVETRRESLPLPSSSFSMESINRRRSNEEQTSEIISND